MFSDKVSEFQHYLNFFKDFKRIVTRNISALPDCIHFSQPRFLPQGKELLFPFTPAFSPGELILRF